MLGVRRMYGRVKGGNEDADNKINLVRFCARFLIVFPLPLSRISTSVKVRLWEDMRLLECLLSFPGLPDCKTKFAAKGMFIKSSFKISDTWLTFFSSRAKFTRSHNILGGDK